jgi:hypothetical protein
MHNLKISDIRRQHSDCCDVKATPKFQTYQSFATWTFVIYFYSLELSKSLNDKRDHMK